MQADLAGQLTRAKIDGQNEGCGGDLTRFKRQEGPGSENGAAEASGDLVKLEGLLILFNLVQVVNSLEAFQECDWTNIRQVEIKHTDYGLFKIN